MIKKLLLLGLFAGVMFIGWIVYFSRTPITLPASSQAIEIKPGSLRSVGQQLVDQKLLSEPWSFVIMVRMLGGAGSVKAGNYLIESGVTPYILFQMLTSGSTMQASITFIEGWNFAQMRAALNSNDAVRQMTMADSDQQILHDVGAKAGSPEGLFFPDTYYFSRGASDREVLRRAYQTMQAKLENAWQGRAQNLPYASAYEALIMASIIEKETGKAAERAQIAGVFLNRLRLGMRLQTDPSVIYGLGSKFDGNLRKQDLLTDTPYNTYTRAGLPPTPIAMPGLASIEAALHPAPTRALYFVGRGDGSHVFSASLEEHNRAVARYQLKKGGNAR